jgi:hypothetical protein
VFAPSNSAFRRLAQDLKVSVASLLQPANAPLITRFLQYHVTDPAALKEVLTVRKLTAMAAESSSSSSSGGGGGNNGAKESESIPTLLAGSAPLTAAVKENRETLSLPSFFSPVGFLLGGRMGGGNGGSRSAGSIEVVTREVVVKGEQNEAQLECAATTRGYNGGRE